MAIQKTATVGNRLVLLSAFVHFSQFHQSQPYIKLCNMMNLRFFGENHKNLLTFTKRHFFHKIAATVKSDTKSAATNSGRSL